MRSKRGVTLTELLVVITISAMTLTLSVTFTQSWIKRQTSHSAIYHVQSHLQLARAQAITRNRDCRFVIDESARRVRVFDLNDPADSNDDIRLADLTLSSTVSFSRPDAGSPITLSPLSGSTYQATFASKGNVSAGEGEIVIQAGASYHKVTLYGAGGVGIERWDGSSWTTEL